MIDPYAGVLPEGIPSTLALAVQAVGDATAQDPAAADELIAANLPPNFLLESVERDDIGVVQTAIVGEFVPNVPDVLAVASRRKRRRLRRAVPDYRGGVDGNGRRSQHRQR